MLSFFFNSVSELIFYYFLGLTTLKSALMMIGVYNMPSTQSAHKN